MAALTDEAQILADDEAERQVDERVFRCQRAAWWLGGLTALLGASVLLGWGADLPRLRAWVLSWVAMQPWAATSFMLCGIALQAHVVGNVKVEIPFSALAALISAVTLAQRLAGHDLGIDRVLFADDIAHQSLRYPGRMAEASSFLFILFFFALMAGRSAKTEPYAWVLKTAGLVAGFTGAMGYLFGASRLTAMGSYVAFALPTAFGWIALYLGANLAEARAGWIRLVISPRLGGDVIRRLIPAAVLLPVVTGFLVHWVLGEAAVQPGFRMGVAMVIIIVGLTAMVGWVTKQLDVLDAQRIRALSDLARSEEAFRAAQDVSLFGVVLLEAVRDGGRLVDFRHRYANPTALRLMGLAPGADQDMLSTCAAHQDGRLMSRYQEVIETGAPLDIEFGVDRNGLKRWFRNLAVKLGDGVAVTFYDVTDRRQAEQALARTEARHRAVLETAVDAMVVIDESGEIRSFNQAAEQIFGYSAEEAIGRNVSLLMPEPDRSAHDSYLDNYRRTGIRKIIGIGRRVTGRRKDSSTVPIELSIAEWKDGDERFFTGIMRDISKRVEAEEALLKGEARFRTLFEQAAVGIAQISLHDNGLLAVNRRFCEMLGFGADELLTNTPGNAVAPAFQRDDPAFQELMRGLHPSLSKEVRYLRRDGTPIWLRVTTSIPEGEVDFRISVFEDITAQKDALANLERTKNRLELALKAAGAGLWEWDTGTNEVIWSQGLYELLGLPATSQPSFENWLEAIHPDDRDAAVSVAVEFARTGAREYRNEFRVNHPQKGVRWLLGLGDRVNDRLVAGINIDVTPLKQAEEEAQRANRAKSTFLAAASHDLRQPVQAMVLLNEALANRLKGHPEGEIVTRLRMSVTALQMLLDGLLDVSRLDAGVIEANPTEVPVGLLLERLHSEYVVRSRPKGLRFRVVPCKAWIRTDPTLLERILRNLIENAIRYTLRGSVLVGCRRSGENLRIGVYDTGVGIPHDKRTAIFQEFFQLSNPERDREKGLGLGLSIVNRLVNLLGHRLHVSSVPGKGSAFVVEVPLATPLVAANDDLAEMAVNPKPGGGVLVIDDEAMIRESLAMTLAESGWDVTTAGDAQEAVRTVAERCPDVILADYRLREGHTGISAAKEVEAACGHAIPTIVLTGDTDPERIAEVKKSGYRIVHKPVLPARLMELVWSTAAQAK